MNNGVCSCNSGWTGDVCETIATCENGRNLTETHGKHKCDCTEYFEGPRCEQIVCFNGQPPNSAGQYCDCSDPYIGNHCKIIPCQRGQIVTDHRSTQCVCPVFFQGPVCGAISGGGIAIAIFAVLPAILLIVLCCCFIHRKCRKKHSQETDDSNPSAGDVDTLQRVPGVEMHLLPNPDYPTDNGASTTVPGNTHELEIQSLFKTLAPSAQPFGLGNRDGPPPSYDDVVK